MEAKKTPKADLEKRRGLYLEIGLVVILAAALVAFNIKSYDKEEKVVNTRTAESEIDVEILNTQEEETPPPPPEEPEVVATDLNVVENDAQDIEEVGIINAGDDANKGADRITNVVVEEEVQEEEDEVFIVVEEDPEFPGGLQKYNQQVIEDMDEDAVLRLVDTLVSRSYGKFDEDDEFFGDDGACGEADAQVETRQTAW